CTSRELQHSRGGSFPTPDLAEAALTRMEESGHGRWLTETNPRGGWPKKSFVLHVQSDTDTCDTRSPGNAAPDAGPSDTRIDTRPAHPLRHTEKPSSVASVGLGIDAAGKPKASETTESTLANEGPSVGASGELFGPGQDIGPLR